MSVVWYLPHILHTWQCNSETHDLCFMWLIDRQCMSYTCIFSMSSTQTFWKREANLISLEMTGPTWVAETEAGGGRKRPPGRPAYYEWGREQQVASLKFGNLQKLSGLLDMLINPVFPHIWCKKLSRLLNGWCPFSIYWIKFYNAFWLDQKLNFILKWQLWT